MNFKKFLGSLLSTMTLFSAQSAMAVDITDETTLSDYMTNESSDKQTGVIQNDITTTTGLTSSNSDVAFQASGNRVLSGELLRFTGTNGKLTLTIVGGDTFTINNTISLDGTTLTNGNAGTYNFNTIQGTGRINLTSGAKFNANNVTANDLYLIKDTSFFLNDATIGNVQLNGQNSILNVSNHLNATTVSVTNYGVLTVADMYISSTLSAGSNSIINAQNIVGGVNTGTITVDGLFSLGNSSSAYADKVTADKVTLSGNSSLDLVSKDTVDSKNGVLEVADTLDIGNGSTVKANTINAKKIVSSGKIIIGKEGTDVSYINTDSMTINKGEYTNTVIKGSSGEYSNVSFVSGGSDIYFDGDLNEIKVKGGSTSSNATVTINDDSKLKISAGADETSNGVQYNGTIFLVGDNSELNLDAVSSDIKFSSGNKMTGITLGTDSSINVSGTNTVTFDNINHDTDSNIGTLNIESGANVKTTAGVKGASQWASGQIFLDKYIQNAGSSMTMLANSMIDANVVEISGGKLDITGAGTPTTTDMSSVKDTIRANTSFTADTATITSSGLTQIISDGAMNFTQSNITINSGSNSILSLSAKEGVNFDSTSNIILNGGELRIFGDDAVVNRISGSIDNAKNQKGTLRKVGAGSLELGTAGVKSSLNIDTIIIGEDKVFSGSADPVGSGAVNIRQITNTEHLIVAGDSTVNVNIIKPTQDDKDTIGSTNSGSEIRFKRSAPEINEGKGPVLNLYSGSLIADVIDLSVKEANLNGGVIGIEGGGTSKVIFGEKSKINISSDKVVKIYVDNATTGGFSAQGSEINIENKGSIEFGSAIGSQAHWNITNANVVQKFKAESWFDGIRIADKVESGGIFYNYGTVIIGDYTNFGFNDGDHPLNLTGDDIGNHVGLSGGAIYNSGFFGSYTLEGTANDVKFTNNTASAEIVGIDVATGKEVVIGYQGYGGAIYNTGEGIIALGTKTKFDSNGAGQMGGAIYNKAVDSIYNIGGQDVSYNAVILGKDTWFITNKAGQMGGAIYSKKGSSDSTKTTTISIGEKAAFDNNVVGLSKEADIQRNQFFFHNAEGGAIYIEDGSTVDIGAHSGMFNNFSSYSGGAISNEGKLIFNDDGKIGDEPLQNGEIVKGSIRIDAGGKRNETKNDIATGNVFYTHQGGAIFNDNGEIYTRRTNLDGSTYLQSGLYNAEFNDNQALFGGAIYNYSSETTPVQLAIENSKFVGNSANRGIEIFYDATSGYSNVEETTSSGGAIYNAGHKVYYTLEDGAAGGQKYIKKNVEYGKAKLKVNNSTFTANTASNKAGAIYNDINTELELSDSEFTRNSATQGGAIYNTGEEEHDGTVYIGATIFTNLGEKGEKIIMNSNTATRQMSGSDETSPTNEFLGGALYNAGKIKQKNSTSSYDNEIIGFEFNANSAGAGQSTSDPARSTIGRGGAFYNASAGKTYVGNTTFDGNYTYAFAKDGEEVQSEGGAIYNEKGTLIIGESTDYDGTVKGVEFTNNGLNSSNETKTNRGGAIYNATGATTIIESTKTKFSGNSAIKEGGAIYNATGATLEIKDGVSIGDVNSTANKADLGGGVFNAGALKLSEGTSFVNNSAYNGGGLYLKKGSTVNPDADGLNHLSKVTFEGNSADYGAGLFVDKDVDIYLDNVMFKGNSTSGLGSAFYNQGKLTLGENNTFFNNSGSLIGNSGELIFTKNFILDGSKKGNEGNTSFITNEEDGVVKITTENGTSLDINSIGNGTADGAAISLLGKSTISTDNVAKTLKNAIFTKNKGKNGGAIYKKSTEDLTIDNTKFDGNSATAKGGAIYNEKDSTIIIGADTTFTNNSANVAGGAIYNAEGGTLTFAKGYKGFANANSKNYSTGNGGAISNDGLMNIYYDDANPDSIIFSNQGKDLATGNGGALHLGSKAIIKTNDESKTSSGYDVGYLKNGVFSNNTANNGGALYNESNLVIEDTMFSGNKSGSAGGAIYNKGNVIDGRDFGILDIIVSNDKTLYNNKSDDKGGAIYNEGGTVNINAKENTTSTISGNTAHNQGGVIASEGGVINVGGNIKFKDNSTVSANSKGGVFSISSGTLNLDTTKGDIVFDNNSAAIGSAIYVENGGKINFKGDDTHGITFSKTQTVASDATKTNQMNVAGGNIKFESSLAGFTGQFTQTGGTFTLANDFMNLNGTHNEVTGGKFILSDGAKLMPTTDTEDNKLNINGATIRFENNDSSKLTDLSVLYQYKDTTKNPFSNVGSTLTYTSDKGDAKIGLSDAKLDLALTQKFVDVIDEKTGEKYRKNSGEYSLILKGGEDKNIDIAKDGRHAVSDLTVGDAVQIATDIKVSNGGKLSLEGAGLSKDVKTIDLKNGGQLNIFNDTYEANVDGVLTKYNTDLTFYGELLGDSTSKIYKGYKTSPTENGLAGRASLIFASGASAGEYMGTYLQNAGTLEFMEGSTYFNHLNSDVSYIEDAKLILNDGVIYTGDTTINFDGKGGKFVLGSATNIDMTHNPTPPPTNEKIVFDAKDKDGNKVTNTVKLGKDTTVQVTHGETNVDASDEIINIGKDNAFSGIIVGGDENNPSSTGPISIKVSTEGIEGSDTVFNVEENGKLGFGDVKFIDSTGADVTGTYSPTVKLGTNSEFYLVSGKDNDFNNLNLSTNATTWSKTSGSLIKENASKTTLTGAKTDLSGFHGTITIKNGQIALGDDVTEDKKFGADTRFDLSKIANGATVIVDNITQGDDMRLINGIGNEIIGTPTGDENYKLSIKNDKGSIIFTEDGTATYTPDLDVKNGSLLKMEAKGDIKVGDVDVISKFSDISGAKQESAAGLKSEGKITTGEIKIIGEKKNSVTANSNFILEAGGDIATGDVDNGYKNVTIKYGDFTATSTNGSITLGDATDTINPALSVVNGSAYIEAGKNLNVNGNVVANGADRTNTLLALKAKENITAGDVTASDLADMYIRSENGDIGLGNVTLTNVAVKTLDSTTEQHASVILADNGAITVKDIILTDMKTNPTYIQAKNDISTGKITLDNASINMISKEGSIATSGNVKVTDSKLEMGALGGTLTFGDVTDTTNPALDVANGSAKILAKSDIKGNGNIKVKDSDLLIKSDEGKVTFGEATDTTNPALSVVNGSAYVVAKDVLTMNGDVVLDSLTQDSLITGSSVSMGGLTSTNNADRTIQIGATNGKLTINGDVTVDDTDSLQILGTNGIDIKATGTKKGDVTITDSAFAAVAETGNINIDGNVSANDSIVQIVVRDSGTGNITIGNNSATTPALSVIGSSAYISSEGITTVNGDILMDNLANISYISGNSVDIKGDVSVKNSAFSTTFYAQDGDLSLGAIDLVNNIDPDDKNVKSVFAANNGSINAKGKVNVEKADIWVSATGRVSLASETDGTGTALKVNGGKAEIFAQDALDINGDVEITAMTDKSVIQGGTISTGKINIHDNEKDMDIVSSVGNISTKDISIKNNNGKLTNIQAKGGITTNNGNVDVANSNLQLVAQDGDVNLGTGTITIDNSSTIISATNGGITSGNIKVSDITGANLPTELGMAAKDGSIKSGNIDLSNNVSLKQITSKTTGSTTATDIINGNIKITDNAKYQASSAGNYTAGDIIANVAEGSESIATILAEGNITLKDITAANLADMYIRSKNGDITANDLTLDKVAIRTIDSETHASIILAENGSITLDDITITDMGATTPTYIQAKNALSAGAISLKNSSANIISTDGDVTATGNVKADTSKIIMSAGGALTFGNVADLTNPALKVNDGSATILAKNDITANGNIDVSKADLIMQSEEGGITIGEATDLTNPALKVANGSAQIDAVGGALNIKGDVDMTAITADALMRGKSVAMENLKLYENTKDSVISATDGDVSIKSVQLTNNKETVSGTTTNKTITINATGGSINVDKDITVASSNLTMVADGGIKGNDLAISDSKVAPSTTGDPYDYGTIISADSGNVSFNKVTINDSVVGIQSTSGDINIDKTLTVADVNKLTRTAINASEGNVSIGKGITAPSDGSSVTAISAGENTYVGISAGKDITIGNNSAKTNVKVTKGQLALSAENDGTDPAVKSNINASKTDFTVTNDDATKDTLLYVIASDNVSVGSVDSTLSTVGMVAQNGKLTVNGNVTSSGSSTSLVGGEGGINVTGSVSSTNNAGTAIQATGDVKVGKNVTFQNNVTTANQLNMNVETLKQYTRRATTTTSTDATGATTTTTVTPDATVNNDTPNEAVNTLIGKIQDIRSDAEYDSMIDGKNVSIGGNLTSSTSNLAIGGRAAVSGLEVTGTTSLDNAVVMINSSGDVVTNGFNVKDSIVTVQSDKLKANSMSVTANADSLAYLEMINNSLAVDRNMTAKNAIINSKYTTNIAVGGAGDFNTAVLNIPNANAQFGSLKTENTMVNLQNNKANNTISVTGDYTVAGDNLFYMDFDPATGAYDRVHVGGAITGADGATITVNSNLISRGDVANGYQIYDVFKGNNGISGVNFGLQGETAYSTALANYQMESLGSGKYAFRRTGYTPTALVNPVAVQLGGFLTQVQTYDTAFDNLDMVMMLPMTAYGPNRYAVEDEEAMVYSPLFIPELEKGVWFRPFANFENVDMHQVGGRISAQTYGALAGGDTALKDLGNGYQGMMSAYVGYTGAHQDLDGVSNYQNGGVVGVTGAIYKNGFFSGLTVSANASGNSASTPYGSNDFFMLSAGAASKTGYNWELANGRFIIQPSWLMSYTFANVFDPNDIAGMKVDSSALHAVQLAPGLKFIGNFQNGWQPYLTVDYRFNICDNADYKVGVVDLPDARVKSYIEYGLGMQKRWGDRFTGYGQFLGRGIGRNGVGLNLGMRWMVGDGRNPR